MRAPPSSPNKAGGVQRISLTRIASDEINIIVNDSGPGIPAETISGLFNTFEAHGSSAEAV
jgi:DNA topoisomerase VI subunit B